MKTIKVKKLHPNAKLPTRAYPNDAGLDIYALEDTYITREPKIVKTGISLEIPPGYECQVRPKSGRSSDGIMVALGTVDAGYRSDVSAIMYVVAILPRIVLIKAGEKIAQLVINKIELPEVLEVEELSTADRDDKGFGSTGLT